MCIITALSDTVEWFLQSLNQGSILASVPPLLELAWSEVFDEHIALSCELAHLFSMEYFHLLGCRDVCEAVSGGIRRARVSPSCSRTSTRPSSDLRSSATDFLFLPIERHHGEVPSASISRHDRMGSPDPGGSILITSAPK